MATKTVRGTELIDLAALEELDAETARVHKIVESRSAEYKAVGEKAVADHDGFKMLRRSHRRVSQLAQERQAAVREAAEKKRPLLSDRGWQELHAEIYSDFGAKRVEVFNDFDQVGAKVTKLEAPWPDGPKWQHSFPQDNIDHVRVVSASEAALHRLPPRHIHDLLTVAEKGTDLPLLNEMVAVSEFLLVKGFTQSYRKQLTDAVEVAELALQTPTSYAQRFAREQTDAMRASLNVWAENMDRFGPDDAVMDLRDPESLGHAILAAFEPIEDGQSS